MTSLLNPNVEYEEESESDAFFRYSGFGKELFNSIYKKYPKLKGVFKFFRDPGTQDIWAICETSEFSFGVELDPDIEVICLWNGSDFEEIGTWQENPEEYAIERIKICYATRT